MKARVIKAKGMQEYFAIKLSGLKVVSGLLEGVELTLQFPACHYDWLEDPEAVISEIAKRINNYSE